MLSLELASFSLASIRVSYQSSKESRSSHRAEKKKTTCFYMLSFEIWICHVTRGGSVTLGHFGIDVQFCSRSTKTGSQLVTNDSINRGIKTKKLGLSTHPRSCVIFENYFHKFLTKVIIVWTENIRG